VSLTVSVGTANAYRIAAASHDADGWSHDQLTLHAGGFIWDTVTTFTGNKTMTFSGLGTSASGAVPTVANSSGTSVNEGTAETIAFNSGVSVTTAGQGILVAKKAETATLNVSDSGGLASTSPAALGQPDGIETIANAYRIAVASVTPSAGANDQLTIRLVDSFGNTVTSFNGDKTLTLAGWVLHLPAMCQRSQTRPARLSTRDIGIDHVYPAV